MLLLVPAAFTILLSVSMLTWYTLYDSQVVLSRSNPHACLEIKNGLDLDKVRNPILVHTGVIGPFFNPKVAFYYEIQDAIERKKKMMSQKD